MTVLNSTKVKRATEKCLLTEFATGGACLQLFGGAALYHFRLGGGLMNKSIKFEYIKSKWYLQDGKVFSKRTHKPVTFSCTKTSGHPSRRVKFGEGWINIYIHEAVFMLAHGRSVADGMVIHHIDGDPLNNSIDNLVELTPSQHKRIHVYMTDDPLRGLRVRYGRWEFNWVDKEGCRQRKSFCGINEAMLFRAEVEEPFRQELRCLGLHC